MDALVAYFEEERGWPKPEEHIWLEKSWSSKIRPFTLSAFNMMWLRLTRRIGLILKQKGPIGRRYGYNPHETRNMAKSHLHTNAKAQGFDMDCCEFWLGHKIDPLGYDKFYNDQEYVRRQYLIAEKHLNIISNPTYHPRPEGTRIHLQRLREQRERPGPKDRIERLQDLA